MTADGEMSGDGNGGSDRRDPDPGPDVDRDAGASAVFERLDEDVVHRGHVITVVRSRFLAPDGSVIERDVVRHPGAVSVVPLWDNHDVTLVSQFRAPLGHYVIEIPAGMRDVDGEPAETCALRELKEEIGVVADRLDRLAVFNNSVGFTDEEGTVFLATGLHDGDPDLKGVEEEHMVAMRVPLAEALAMIDDQRITDAKTIIGLTLTARRIGLS